ncbi:MAG: hypothetical protein VB144_13665 [Clostridia bacterium]|nr:hypothetical protein [Clostridia bacterium]
MLLPARKANTLEKNLLKQREELETSLKQLGTVEFACESDARAALEKIKHENRSALYEISGDVQAEEQVLRRVRPGRPRALGVSPSVYITIPQVNRDS